MELMVLLRHGETAWSRDKRHTGRTDLPLTPRGEQQAAALAGLVAQWELALVLCSPAQRARRTAELAGATPYKTDPDLWEWDYGGYEGRTTSAIRQERPGWYLWRDGVPPGADGHPGESCAAVGRRTDRMIALSRHAAGPVLLVAHGHVLRVLTARWLGLPPEDGRFFRLDTGTYCILGFEHGLPALDTWNAPAPP